MIAIQVKVISATVYADRSSVQINNLALFILSKEQNNIFKGWYNGILSRSPEYSKRDGTFLEFHVPSFAEVRTKVPGLGFIRV